MKLNVITTVSNPCDYKNRYQLAENFIKYMSSNPLVDLYVVELAYSCNNKYVLNLDKKYLKLYCDTPMWHKENLINICVEKLLPKDWKNFAWIDADVEFLNKDWANVTLDYLKNFDVLQMFSFCHDLDENSKAKKTYSSLCQNYCLYEKGRALPDAIAGFAWAINREFYDKIGGLFEYGIIGGADLLMYNCFSSEFSRDVLSPYFFLNNEFKKTFLDYYEKCKNCKLGYLPLLLKHYFHGDRKNRKYSQRMNILSKYNFSLSFLEKDDNGILIKSSQFPENLDNEFLNYFLERKEDSTLD